MQVTDDVREALDTLDDVEKLDGAKIHAADVIAAYRKKLPQDELERVYAHLGDGNAAVRHSLVRAMIYSGNETAISHLEGVLERERVSDWVRRSAEIALHRLRNDLEVIHTPTVLYVGEVKDGTAAGEGRMYYTYSGEMIYEGGFKEGNFHGSGTYYNDDGTLKHMGMFVDGKFQG